MKLYIIQKMSSAHSDLSKNDLFVYIHADGVCFKPRNMYIQPDLVLLQDPLTHDAKKT